jgi:ketosteroid isomerase-like protein
VTPDDAAHLDLLRRYLRAVETFAPREVVAEFFTDDAVQREFPNRLFAGGREHDIRTMMANYDKGRELLSEQTYVLRKAVVQGDEVAAEIEWSGVLRVGVGSLAAGASMRAAIAIFFTFRDGKIASLRNYDCYYPF